MTWTYDQAQLATSRLSQIRLLLGDVKQNGQQLQDEEIASAISLANSTEVFAQAAQAARLIAARYAREVDSVQAPEMRQMFSARMDRYLKLARTFDARLGIDPAAGLPSAGGISVADKDATRRDPDATRPSFYRGFGEASAVSTWWGNSLPDIDKDSGYANG